MQTRLKGEALQTDANPRFGKKVSAAPHGEKPPRPELKHFNPNPSIQIGDNFLQLSSQFFERFDLLSQEKAQKKRPDLYRNTYDPYHPSNAGFKSLDDKVFNKKQYSYEQTRNSIPVHSLGDKAYKHPTFQPGFYKEPGVYPGSTNVLRSRNRAKINMVDFTIDANAVYPFYPTVKYSDRLEKDRIQLETKQVSDLDLWEENLQSAKAPVDLDNGKKDPKNKN